MNDIFDLDPRLRAGRHAVVIGSRLEIPVAVGPNESRLVVDARTVIPEVHHACRGIVFAVNVKPGAGDTCGEIIADALAEGARSVDLHVNGLASAAIAFIVT